MEQIWVFVHVDNKKKDILILGKGPTQGLEHTLMAEKLYLIYFTVTRKKFCLSLHYNGAKVICLLMVKKFINSKQKILKLCYVYNFSVNYEATAVDGILDIHNYLMKNNDIV